MYKDIIVIDSFYPGISMPPIRRDNLSQYYLLVPDKLSPFANQTVI